MGPGCRACSKIVICLFSDCCRSVRTDAGLPTFIFHLLGASIDIDAEVATLEESRGLSGIPSNRSLRGHNPFGLQPPPSRRWLGWVPGGSNHRSPEEMGLGSSSVTGKLQVHKVQPPCDSWPRLAQMTVMSSMVGVLLLVQLGRSWCRTDCGNPPKTDQLGKKGSHSISTLLASPSVSVRWARGG